MNIKDIAAIADVSVSTVSKVLNRKDKDISVATRKRVLQVIQEYQYVPYSKIRKNTAGRNNLLGVLIAKENFEYMEILHIVEQMASQQGYSIIVSTLDEDRDLEEKQIKVMEGKNVDGYLLIGDFHKRSSLIKQLLLERMPCVAIGTQKNKELEIPVVVYDEERIAYQAVKFLIELQHADIGCMVSDGSGMVRGYQRALYDFKIDFDKTKIFQEDICSLPGQTKFREWISMNYTAVLCEDTESAIYLYRVFQEKGIAIPGDVSVICGKDSKYLELLNPPVTAVKSVYKEIAESAVGQIAYLIETKEEYQKQPDEILFEIRERKSTAAPADWHQGQKLVVVGSMNMDITISVPHIPKDGETILSNSTALIPGGKGANQAVGSSKLGGKVHMIGCLGNDADGKELYNSLINNKVHTQGIAFDGTLPTGKAYINVSNNNGESTIVIYPGANQKLDQNHIQKHSDMFDGAKFCLLSLEIPIDAARFTVSLCKRKGTAVIVKPSGLTKIERQFVDGIAYFVPNSTELNNLIPEEGTIEEKAEKLWNMGAQNIIVTLGKEGCYLKNESYSRFFKAADFTAVDTTGGADAFVSALAVYLSEGVSLIHSIGFATHCAGICVTRPGVQPAMPDRVGVDMYQDIIYAQFQTK